MTTNNVYYKFHSKSPEEARAFQEWAFKQGYGWLHQGSEYRMMDAPWFFLDNFLQADETSLVLTYGSYSNEGNFEEFDNYILLTMQNIAEEIYDN